MDRQRLKQVHQTDLTESRVNEAFVDWLKERGPTWLLVGLVMLVVFLAVVRWRQHQARAVDSAWAALGNASLPMSKEDVALEHPDVFAVPQLARLQAAAQLMQAVQSGKAIGAAEPAEGTEAPAPADLTDSDRQEYLARAERDYQAVLDSDTDEHSLGMTLHAVKALNGLAAVAESRGDLDQARQWYEKAAARAEGIYPALAAQARQRAESLNQMGAAPDLMSQAELTTRDAGLLENRPDPISIDKILDDLIFSPEDDEG